MFYLNQQLQNRSRMDAFRDHIGAFEAKIKDNSVDGKHLSARNYMNRKIYESNGTIFVSAQA